MLQSIRCMTILLGLLSALGLNAARASVFVSGDMTQEKRAQPGERYRGTILLKSTDPVPVEVKVYQTDYHFTADGHNFYGEPGGLPRSNAKWVRLSRELVVVPANGTERVDYEVSVPGSQGPGLSGTYWSLVMVEPIAAGARESGQVPENAARITQVLRYGVQVVTHLGGAGAANLVFTNPQLLKEDGKSFFAIDVENTGSVLVRPSLSLELYSKTGNPVGKFQGEALRLFPGTSACFKIDIGQPPKGQYLGLVVADGTGDNLFGANVELEVK